MSMPRISTPESCRRRRRVGGLVVALCPGRDPFGEWRMRSRMRWDSMVVVLVAGFAGDVAADEDAVSELAEEENAALADAGK